MSEPLITDVLADPLSDVTRKERRNVLIASTVALSVVLMGLIPSKVSALGIELGAPAQKSFLVLVAALVLYFLLAFVIYGLTDLFVRISAHRGRHFSVIVDGVSV